MINIACLGAGYVGVPSMTVLADRCPDVKVTVLDLDANKIASWMSDRLPIYEPGLDEIVSRTINKTLFFSCEIEKHLREADIIFICVNTPTKTAGFGAGAACDLTYVELAARSISEACHNCSHKIVVEKSTVPVRCGEIIANILYSTKGPCRYSILSNPEFLAEGTAISDLEDPDRVLIGGEDDSFGREAQQLLIDLYSTWIPKDRILTLRLWSSELSKLAANALLSQRISSVNSLSAICEATGADIEDVERAVGMDHRIGPHFLRAGVGFGGSCFRKDVLNLVYIAQTLGLEEVARYWQGVIDINNWQMERFAKNVVKQLFDNVSNKYLAILGFSFKANTGDTRDSPAIRICRELLSNGAKLNIYDPKVSKTQILYDLSPHGQDIWKIDSSVQVYGSVLSAVHNCDGILVLTDWQEFHKVDWVNVYQRMRKPAFIFDGRLCLDHQKLRRIGYRVSAVGKPVTALAATPNYYSSHVNQEETSSNTATAIVNR
ncbi:hypothetical protein RCL1_008787 [Eukaryota sp. TZLM3-RCL]